MDTVTPTPIKLDDLNRDELLELISRVYLFVRPRDLLSARWEVACRKSDAAGAASIVASDRSAAAAAAWNKAAPGTPAYRRSQEAYFKARAESVAASRAADRAYAAQERAYRALDACKP